MLTMTMYRALQERLLARRVLHYNARQMYFECNEGVIAEDGSRLRNRYRDLRAAQRVWPRTESPQKNDDALNIASIENWYSVVWAYGRRNLSRPTDMLPARMWIPRVCFLLFAAQVSRHFLFFPPLGGEGAFILTDLCENASKRYC